MLSVAKVECGTSFLISGKESNLSYVIPCFLKFKVQINTEKEAIANLDKAQ